MYEANGDVPSAVACYEKAAHYFLTDNKKSNAKEIKIKTAVLLTSNGERYTDAAAIFEAAG